MDTLINLLKQRRIWVGILGTISFALPLVGVSYDLDINTLTDLFTNLGLAIANLMTAALAIHSYFFPKR